MRGLIVKKGSAHVGQTCRQCTRTIKPRQAIIVDVVAEARFGTGAVRRWHKACLADVIDKAPNGVDELNELRDRMVAENDAFVA